DLARQPARRCGANGVQQLPRHLARADVRVPGLGRRALRPVPPAGDAALRAGAVGADAGLVEVVAGPVPLRSARVAVALSDLQPSVPAAEIESGLLLRPIRIRWRRRNGVRLPCTSASATPFAIQSCATSRARPRAMSKRS